MGSLLVVHLSFQTFLEHHKEGPDFGWSYSDQPVNFSFLNEQITEKKVKSNTRDIYVASINIYIY